MAYIETADDYAKKYHHTFVRYKGEIAYIHSFAGDEQNGMIATVLPNPGKGVTQQIEPKAIEPLVFDSKFVNGSGRIAATLFVRNPRRMWKRGLSEENTRLTCPIMPLYRLFGKRMSGWETKLSFLLVRELDNSKYPSITEALDRIADQEAIAISPMFAITLSSICKERCLLASAFGFIGEVDVNGIYIHHQPALQEVRDFVQRTKQSFPVEAMNAN